MIKNAKRLLFFTFLSCSIYAQDELAMTKVVIPAAGYGTRSLPCTKSIPKELLPLLNETAAQKIVTECLVAGFNQCCFIVSESKKAIKHYFAPNAQFERDLKRVGKLHFLDGINALIEQVTFTYIDQPVMKGLGHAVLMAKPFINKHEYFGVILPDMFMFGAESPMLQVARIARKYKATVIAVQKVAPQEVSAYGTIKIGTTYEPGVFEVTGLVEKPKSAAVAPSLYAIMGRYIFTTSIFEAIEKIAPQAQGEIQLTDAIAYLVAHGERVIAYEVQGKLFDIGRPQGWLGANIYLGLQSPEYGEQVRTMLKELL